jgi:polar amino acid transport system permease protein
LRTVEVSAASIAIGSALGLFVGLALAYGPRALRWPVRFYVDVVRGTPVLVLVLASFYVLAVVGIHFSAVQAGIFALSIFCGAHMGEIVRGALQAIPTGQTEAARSLGLRFPLILRLVLIPQALRQIVPVWINIGAELVKASTLLSVIGVGELLLKTQEIVGRNFMTLEFYLVTGFLYFIVNYGIERVGKRAERRFALR